MLRRIIVTAITVGAVITFTDSAYAFQLGQAIDNSPYSPIPVSIYPTPNSDAESSKFLSKLINPTTQNFNNFAPGDITTLPLNFGDAGTAIFQGKGTILTGTNYPNSANIQILATANAISTVNLFPATFDEIDFAKPVSAIGFSASLPTDFYANSTTSLKLTKVDGTITDIPVEIGSSSFAFDSSQYYIDVLADNLSEQFTKIAFVDTSSRIQPFALSNITAAGFSQIKTASPVLEPTSILGSLGAITFGIVLRRKVKR